MSAEKPPLVGVIMGSNSDLDIMQAAPDALELFDVPYEVRIISAHRTPDEMRDYAQTARKRGIRLIIAGAGGSAHLQGMTAVFADVPVLAVPIKRDNHDHEALWSNIKMPKGAPLATFPENGAYNAGLFAVEMLAMNDETLFDKYHEFRDKQRQDVIALDAQVQQDWRGHIPS